MHCSSTRHADMDKENATVLGVDQPTVRITRARAKALGTAGRILSSSKPSFKHDQKHVRANSKRAASDESKASVIGPSGCQHKRRAVLKDVTNINCEDPSMHCINVTKVQTNKQARRGPSKKNPNLASDVSVNVPVAHDDAKTKLAEELSKIRMEESEDTLLVNLTENEPSQNCMSHHIRECGVANPELLEQPSNKPALQNSIQKEDILEQSKDLGIVDIDSNLQDPQVYSLYAPDIYQKMRVTEFERRSSINYMENLQRDITPNMRGILIDWLVEVSEEYKLVPDTLYLTVNLIDRFLSENYIVKQRLQLLGVACMLIASKYEEICAPRVEEFCFITDNTYTNVEVLKMESQILNFLHFQLSVPTTKTFLRRFILAAQVSYKAPCIEMELLANYLAELTLLEYSFLKFLPSLIAASAVFLARWTLNQSDHPWNPTLEHYTNYKAPQLKTTVLALEDLQNNTNGCALNAIREKYKQLKFKRVATLTSCKSVVSLF